MRGESSFEVLRHSGSWEPIRPFWDDEEKIIFVFHDGVEHIGAFLDQFDFQKPALIVITCQWFVSPDDAADCARRLDAALSGANRLGAQAASFLIVANSDLEQRNLRAHFPPEMVARGNNSATLSEQTFRPHNQAKLYDAVLNAKAWRFKRHALAAQVANTAFISYRTIRRTENIVDIEALKPAAVFWGVPTQKVVEVVNSSRVGLALSAREGACYASLEYLLCGLPVVSTPSQGGRDDFYAPETAVIAEATPAGVAKAVATARAKLDAGEFAAATIRRDSLARVELFRSLFEEAVASLCRRNGLTPPPEGLLAERARVDSKLTQSWIYWPQGFRRRP